VKHFEKWNNMDESYVLDFVQVSPLKETFVMISDERKINM
jgi:hypothetical protein